METALAPTGSKLWAGGKSPFKVSYGKLMMWYFLLSDSFTFGAFLISYGTIRFSQNYWVDHNEVFNSFPGMGDANLPLTFVSVMTFILIFSSVTMVLAVHEGHKMNKKGVQKYLLFTILGGLAFLGCQAIEWTHLLTAEHPVLVNGVLEHWTTTTTHNPWGPKVMFNGELVHTPGPVAFGGYFFGITGFHGFHVSIGVILLIITYIQTNMNVFHNRGHYEMVEKIGLYWHFVDLVWVFVFLVFYLI